MGHHSIQITVDTYGHLIPGANREAVNRLTEMVERSATDTQLNDDSIPGGRGDTHGKYGKTALWWTRWIQK
jgi:hypothetical protein